MHCHRFWVFLTGFPGFPVFSVFHRFSQLHDARIRSARAKGIEKYQCPMSEDESMEALLTDIEKLGLEPEDGATLPPPSGVPAFVRNQGLDQ